MLCSLKLKERLDAGLPNTSPSSDTSEPPQPGMGSPPPPVDDWLISIKKNLEKAGKYDAARPWGKVSIYRVPLCLRDPLRKEAYIPQVVSLGPYHHGRKHLQPMELHKWRALNNIIRRNNQSIELYVNSMKELEDSARARYEGPLKLSNNGFAEMMMYEGQLKLSCNEFAEMMMYEGQLEHSSNDFGEMMMLDGCFVLELFHGYAYGFEKLGYAWNDPVFSRKVKLQSIRREMLMLENQIPLIVLGKLLELQLPDELKDQAEHAVAWLAIQFLCPLMRRGRNYTTYDPQSDKVGLHCLDVFRKYLLSKGPDNVQSLTTDSTTSDPKGLYKRLFHFRKKRSREADNRSQKRIYCATDLKDAGVKFRKHKTDRLWDIRFNNGVLDIPPIRIDDSTKPMLCNLIAFEQCHFDCKQDITNYVAFLDDLINSAEDVSYLRRDKIIENLLGSDREVADLVNSLCQEVVVDFNDTYSKLYKKINEHYDRKWKWKICRRTFYLWWATLKQKYFSNPWSILSFVAAVLLLLMSAAQTFYTVYPYYVPRK